MAILKRRKTAKVDDLELREANGIQTVAQLLKFAWEKLGIKTFPLNVRALIKSLGISLTFEPMENEKSGYIRRDDDGWIIGINSLHHPNRQRFTMAHELGHYFLHRHDHNEIEDFIMFRSNDDGYGKAGMEREANEFAAQLLMPKQSFQKAVGDYEGEISEISNRFGVSQLAVIVRAKELKSSRS